MAENEREAELSDLYLIGVVDGPDGLRPDALSRLFEQNSTASGVRVVAAFCSQCGHKLTCPEGHE